MHFARTFQVFGLRYASSPTTENDATKAKLQADTSSFYGEAATTEHELPLLIFDELEYQPFTENRRWANGN
jgi:hypothetical protein